MDKLLLPLPWTSAGGHPSALTFGTASKARLAAHIHSKSKAGAGGCFPEPVHQDG